MEIVKERIDQETPQIIQDLFFAAYRYFSYKFWSGGFKDMVDVGCGNGSGSSIMEKFFSSVIKIDKDLLPFKNSIQMDVTDMKVFEDDSFDGSFCFEVIEHLDELGQKQLLSEINRISRKGFVVGSINKDGPDHIQTIEIFKGERNPYHLKELSIQDFVQLKDFYKRDGYGARVLHLLFNKDTFSFISNEELVDSRKVYCNYLIITK